ncbi:MAG TPA: glycosyltransferase family 39 protein [Candidatus Polarisedimenticolia bacterium]|nr:glycosyltransferase family 39 protein [Candidatus Polarisedimenticolia bacterium]
MPFLLLAFVALVTWLPGRLMMRNLTVSVRRELVDEDTAQPLGWALSYLLIATIQLATTWIGTTPILTNSVLYVASVAILWLGARRRGAAPIPAGGPAAVGFALFVTYLLTLLLFLPSYQTAFSSDWRLYYPNTFAYLGQKPLSSYAAGVPLEYLAKRTPEMSLYGSFFVSLLGQSYDRFQIACLLPNAWVFWVVYLFAMRLFGRRAAVSALLILPLSPAILRTATIPEPKFVGAFFVLLSAYYYLLAREDTEPARSAHRGAVSGGLAVAAFMCHPSMFFYSLWVGADQILLLWRRRKLLLRPFLLGAGASALFLAAPWYLWLLRSFGGRTAFTPTAALAQPLPLSFGECVVTRLKMVVTTLAAPSYLVKKLLHDSPFPPDYSTAALAEHLRAWGNLVLRFYDQTFLGGMTVAVGLTLLLFGWSPPFPGSVRPGRAVVFAGLGLGAGACFFALLSRVDNEGNATNMLSPLFLLVLCYAGCVLSRLPAWGARLVLAAAVLEMIADRMLIFFITHDMDKRDLDYLYEWTRSRFAGPAILAPILLAAILLLAYCWSVQRIASERSDSTVATPSTGEAAPLGSLRAT